MTDFNDSSLRHGDYGHIRSEDCPALVDLDAREDEPKTTLTGRFLPDLTAAELSSAIARLKPPVFVGFDPSTGPDQSVAIMLDRATRKIVDAVAIPPEILLSMDTRELELKLVFDMVPLLPDRFMRPFVKLATLPEGIPFKAISFPHRYGRKTRSKGMRRHIRRQKEKGLWTPRSRS